jgi:hypothetical protein
METSTTTEKNITKSFGRGGSNPTSQEVQMKINKQEILASISSLNVWSNKETKMFDVNGNWNIGHYFSLYRRFELCVIDYDCKVKLLYKGKSKKDLWNYIQSLIKKAKEVQNV